MQYNDPFLNLSNNISTKKVTQKEESFLRNLYINSREDEPFLCSMSQTEKINFLSNQFYLKEQDYKLRFQDAHFLVLQRKKKNIGRITYKIKDTIHLIDLILSKKVRSKGFGTKIMQILISYAKYNNKVLELKVSTENLRALKFYHSLNLQITAQNRDYYTMQIHYKKEVA